MSDYICANGKTHTYDAAISECAFCRIAKLELKLTWRDEEIKVMREAIEFALDGFHLVPRYTRRQWVINGLDGEKKLNYALNFRASHLQPHDPIRTEEERQT